MTDDLARVFQVLDARSGRIEETTPPSSNGNGQSLSEEIVPYPRDHRGRLTVDHENVDVTLTEASTGPLTTANFPDLLRMGVQFDVFSGFNEPPVLHPLLAREVQSNKQQEEYLKDAGIGLLPIVAEGQPYPEAAVSLDDGVTIANYKRGFTIPVTEEMQKFDQLGKVRDLSNLMGRAARLTEDHDFWNVVTTTTNYTRTEAAGDNDEGANQQTLTFSGTGLITAFNVLTTMKDRRSSMLIGVNPDTLVVTPKLWWAARQLINSPEAMRVGGNTTNEIHGGGTENTFFNAVRTIIVAPLMGKEYEWALMEARRAIYFQRVEGLQVLTEAQSAATTTYIERDVIRYRVRNWYGVGMKDDRFAFYSDSTTSPTIA